MATWPGLMVEYDIEEASLWVTCQWPYISSNENGDRETMDYEAVIKLFCMQRPIPFAEKGHNHIYQIIIYSWHKVSQSGEVYSIQHYVIKFVSDLRQVCGFLRAGTPVSSTNEIDNHYMTEILLKVALNTINQTACDPLQGFLRSPTPWHISEGEQVIDLIIIRTCFTRKWYLTIIDFSWSWYKSLF